MHCRWVIGLYDCSTLLAAVGATKNSTAGLGTEATLGLRPISSVTLYRIAQYKIPLAFNALYFPYSETTHLFGVNSTD